MKARRFCSSPSHSHGAAREATTGSGTSERPTAFLVHSSVDRDSEKSRGATNEGRKEGEEGEAGKTGEEGKEEVKGTAKVGDDEEAEGNDDGGMKEREVSKRRERTRVCV